MLDLFAPAGPADRLINVSALPLSLALRLLHNGRLRPSPAARRAWAAHARRDRYLTIPLVRRMCAALLPGATVTRHVFWRYSIVWRKPRQPRW